MKLRIKVGADEFDADGDDAVVQQAARAWFQMVGGAPTDAPVSQAAVPQASPERASGPIAVLTGRPWNEPRPCARCGKPFTPANGTGGRFCSRGCYEGTPVQERRAALLEALKSGSAFASALADLPAYAGMSRATVSNDLNVLARQGAVENSDDGWRLVSAASTEESVQAEAPFRVNSPMHSGR